ncbi:MAG: class II fructose-bisphosphatase [Nitriliruptoraceae bacterium]
MTDSTDRTDSSAAGPKGLGASDRNLALEMVRVTEAAAMAAARRMGFGDKEAADQAAVDAMRGILEQIPMDGIVVIGEGEKDEAPMLYNGELIGDGSPPAVDIAVDPVEGTTLTAKGLPNALAVIALSERGTMFDPGPFVYMDKLATGPLAADVIDFEAPIGENIRRVAKAKGTHPADVTVSVLDRPRHEQLVREIREAGARIAFIFDGDVAGAIMAARPDTGVDLSVGVGGTPEGVITACAMKCLGGALYGRLAPRSDRERSEAINAGYDVDKVLTADDLVRSDRVIFAGTGITDGALLRGVRFTGRGATTQSLSMRSSSGTVRVVSAEHTFSKFNTIARFAALDELEP